MNRIHIPAPWLFSVVAAAVFLLNFFVFERRPDGDDALFSAAINKNGLWEFLQYRYMHWSGRVPNDIALVLLNHMVVWKVLNACMLLLLCYSIGRIGFADRLSRPASMACAFALFMLVTPGVLSEAAWWVTGSLNYLWAAAMGAYGALQFLDRRERSTLGYLSLMLASGLAVYNEQVAIVMVGMLAPIMWRLVARGAWNKWDIAHIGFLLLNAAIGLAAPGARNRYELEQIRWFANFDTLDLMEKANIGMGLVSSTVVNAQNLLIAMLAAISACFVLRSPASRWARIAMLGGLMFVGANYLVALSLPADSRLAAMYDVAVVSGVNAAWSKAYAVMAVSAFSTLCLVAATALVFFERSPREALLTGWVLLAALASVAALGLSPTAFVSGDRIRFVALVVFLAVTCRALAVFRERYGESAFKGAMALAGAVAALRILQIAD